MLSDPHNSYENGYCGCGEPCPTLKSWEAHRGRISDVSTQDEHAQPMPVLNDGPSIQSLVQADLEERERIGVQRYGTKLQAHNGRDALRDLYEELLDGACYVRQVMEERNISAEPVEDGGLRDLIAQAMAAHPMLSNGYNDRPGWYLENGEVDAVLAVVAPVLAGKDLDLQVYAANFEEIQRQLAEMIDADEQTPIPELLTKVRAELDLRFATRQQYAEERDEAVAANTRLRAELERAGERLASLSTAFGFLGEVLGVDADDIDHYGMVNQVAELQRARDRLRAELDALKAKAVVLPDNWKTQLSWLFDVRQADAWTKVTRLVEMWQGKRNGTADPLPATEATDPPPSCPECLCAAPFHKTSCAGDGYRARPADAPATPTEPRVWRKGDPEPPIGTTVRTRNGRVIQRRSRDSASTSVWADVSGHWSTWTYWSNNHGPLTEVSVDQAGGRS